MTRSKRRKQRQKQQRILGMILLIFVLTGVLIIYAHTKHTHINAASTAMPVVSEQVTPEKINPRYGFTDDDIYLLAQLLCGSKNIDGDGEYDIDFKNPESLNYYEISKVLCVVMNRIRDERFPSTVTDVIMESGQFAVMPKNSKKIPSDIAIMVTTDWCNAYDGNDIGTQCIPENHVYFTGNGVTNTTRENL